MWKYPDNDEYLGNIWGWRFSIFGAVLMLSLVLLMAIVAYQRGVKLTDIGRNIPSAIDTSSAPNPIRR